MDSKSSNLEKLKTSKIKIKIEIKALFTFPDRISIRREAPDVGDRDEGIAVAIAEEQSPTDGCLAADRKLTEKVNKAEIKIKTCL